MRPGTTLERLARLEEQMEFVRTTVAEIRTTQVEIRDTVVSAKGGIAFGRAVLGGAKLVLSGSAGAAVLAAVQHLAKVAVVAALVVPMIPARADESFPVVGWQLEVTACRGPVCKERRREVGNRHACQTLADAVLERRPERVTVRTSCVEVRSAQRGA